MKLCLHFSYAVQISLQFDGFFEKSFPSSNFRANLRFSFIQDIFLISGQHAGQSDVRLRRRLSDKDKHRLVRRSSSKKNKENGSESTSGESGKCDNAETADRREGGGGGHTPVLKRTTSADSSSSNSHNHHAILARTRSEEGGQGASPGPGASPASGASDLIARSLPRI